MPDFEQNIELNPNASETVDVIIVGAGFSGLYMLYCLRKLSFTARIVEAGDGVGGTWYWNRYPGARCDIESLQYSYSFSEDLRHDWHWTEQYAGQPEILRYLNYVTDKFDLRKDIQFETRVTSAVFDEALSRWNIQTNSGDRISAKFCIMATGCLSNARIPNIEGLETFQGNIYHTGEWPHKSVNFSGCRVAVVGTGSSGVQSIPVIAEQADYLYVFQRTPCYSVPSYNAALNAKDEQQWQMNYDEHRCKMLSTAAGIEAKGIFHDKSALDVSSEERQQAYEARWNIGGLPFIRTFNDLMVNKEANDTAAEFLHSKILGIVKDRTTAEALLPHSYPLGCKRLCLGNYYFETYNRDNVTLVDLQKEKIEQIVPIGIKTECTTYKVDSIVFATGFDAMTGALNNIDVQGRSHLKLRAKWTEGPRTYLGIMTAQFPNLFIITGPGSPSVLSNMVVSIEQHVEWIAVCLNYLRQHHLDSIEATLDAEDAWVNQVNTIANATLLPTANSWYMGANIPGKARVFMPYAGGIVSYRQKCKDVAENKYEGFRLTALSPLSTN